MQKKSEKQKKKMVRMQLSGLSKAVSDLNRLRKLTDRKIQNAINKDPDAAPVTIVWHLDDNQK